MVTLLYQALVPSDKLLRSMCGGNSYIYFVTSSNHRIRMEVMFPTPRERERGYKVHMRPTVCHLEVTENSLCRSVLYGILLEFFHPNQINYFMT